MNKYPNVTQKLILRAGKRVLLLRYKEGTYGFPGGQIEWGEDLFPSLQRELKEELNFSLHRQPRLFHVYDYRVVPHRHSVVIYYIQKIPRPLRLTSPEGHEVLWYTEKELNGVFHHPDFVKKIFSWRNPHTKPSIHYAS